MGNKLYLQGQTFGRLKVIKESKKIKGRIAWVCLCVCGNYTQVATKELRNGNKTNCGCLNKTGNYKHGYNCIGNIHPLYKVWIGIKKRCYDKNFKQFKDYGGRGISICDKWLNDPKEFIEWGLANGYRKGLDIDRINNDGEYSPENCRFVTRSINCVNKRKQKNNTSGCVGVRWHKKTKKWRPDVSYNKKRYYLGLYFNINDAVHARNRFIRMWDLPHKIQEHI